jgi:hypothetical protein
MSPFPGDSLGCRLAVRVEACERKRACAVMESRAVRYLILPAERPKEAAGRID